MTAMAQREKEEAEKKQKEEEEKKIKQEEARHRKINSAKGPTRSSIPVKQNTQSVQMPSQASSSDISRLGDMSMTELEDMFEEGL